MRFFIPTILIAISITGFLMFTNPAYDKVVALRTQIASYDEALTNSKSLENEKDKLIKKNNAFNVEDIKKLKKLLPDNVDNIRLILEIEKLASPYGMTLKNVKYDTETEDTKNKVGAGIQGGKTAIVSNKDYGTWTLAFSTAGTYNNFVNFVKDLENNLRIVDISSVQFSSTTATGLNPAPSSADSYKYDVSIKTYWLKN